MKCKILIQICDPKKMNLKLFLGNIKALLFSYVYW